MVELNLGMAVYMGSGGWRWHSATAVGCMGCMLLGPSAASLPVVAKSHCHAAFFVHRVHAYLNVLPIQSCFRGAHQRIVCW